MKFEFLEHTADAKFRAYGKSLEEAFGNAAIAMFNVITDTNKIEKKVEKEITAQGEDKESLLYDFLEKLLILIDSEGFLLNDVKSINISEDNKLEAEVIGDSVSEKHEIKTDIKAVTYNEMFIKQEGEEWIIQVVVDI